MDISQIEHQVFHYPMNITKLENELAGQLRQKEILSRNDLLFSLLTSSDKRVVTMGLRLVKRCIDDKHTLKQIVKLCFKEEKLAIIERFYEAILSKYSYRDFSRDIINEIESRNNENFFLLHSSAIYIVFNKLKYQHAELESFLNRYCTSQSRLG